MLRRYLERSVAADLRKKMVLLAGPRQVGKTTLARSLAGRRGGYLNWDIDADRAKILQRQHPTGDPLVLDEIHKYRAWRNYLKGLYDGSREHGLRILVTGSARLDFYRRGGDSLQGRYFFYRLHPLSLAELGDDRRDTLRQLLTLGGFPEPFFSQSERDARRWSLDYRTRLVREDLASLERFEDLGAIELLLLRLPALVGSPLSLNALREDLQVSHHAVRRWLDGLERLYAFFRLAPFGAPRIRAVKKEQKHYHFDWTLVLDPALRFENLVACALRKWVDWRRDAEGEEQELRYFRDVDRREVDFVLVDGRGPRLFVECKLSDAPLSPALRYLVQRFPAVPAWQIAANGTRDVATAEGIRLAPAATFLRTLV
ncbi:MAG: ATP-binding protein [Deltaproteobacteria bacterium]|nr:ATP-binding protein [Deltaproteobacteria bacterium]